ncbi:MAG TPA: valine--tRNA ligase [Candidatus Saccharimonadales bacterium]|nr:valine--tRNA ligase [Candidatus Saccharimonadales bacterium]
MKLPKVYEPHKYEADIYALWEKSRAFTPASGDKHFSIVMPPPNANANLHIGYELTAALEDIAARYHRQRGKSVLLLPGADHAGFETQSVYENHLAREGKSRFDFSRETLYQQIWDFVAQNRNQFEDQLRKMGVSCDWSRFTFTLDDKIVRLAYSTFKKMWDEGLIYRGERLVNFCTYHGTAFADIEVVFKEEKGHLWQIRYPLVDGSGEVVVATTRPETMLGDTAVAVHPKDNRYTNMIGKTVKLPLTLREIPILADEFVDMKFGTGAVKITPAHDFNDFEVGKRHDLPFISVIDHEGKLTNVPEIYRGLTVIEGRKKVIADLDNQNYLIKTEPYTHNVGHCYKCDTVIEPLLREQWFVNMQPLAKEAIKSLKGDQITFYPNSKKTQLITYLEGLKDWNISRQIAWGIPIPAFQNIDDPDDWIYDDQVQQEIIKHGSKTYRRDPDVLDTWFSSSSWPYSTLNYPDGEDFNKFYPLSLMETGGEILYPWVSRMIMLGLYMTGKVPFHEVYVHGYVMAEDGSKMAKSVGNVVDPLPVIKEFGSDALRMGIISGRSAAVNRGYDQRKVEEARNFCNKLWNIARYVEDVVGDITDFKNPIPETIADHWILTKLQQTQKRLMVDLDKYRFSDAYDAVYHFVWDDLADWYVEASKAAPNKALLAYLLQSVLKLTHPFAPFLTESVWQTLAWESDSILAKSTLAPILTSDNKKSKDFTEIQNIVREVRLIASNLKDSGLSLNYIDTQFLAENAEIIKQLAGIKSVRQVPDASTGFRLITTKYPCWLEINKATAKAYSEELEGKRTKQSALIKQLERRLANKSYTRNAPKAVVDQTRQQLATAEISLSDIVQQQKRFRDQV